MSWADIGVNAFVGDVRGSTQQIERAGAAALLQWRYGLWNGNVKAEYVREDDIVNARSREKTAIFVTVTRKLWQ